MRTAPIGCESNKVELYVGDGNFAVYALKRGATEKQAQDDFMKLDEMFERLLYPMGFFINVQSNNHFLHLYSGVFPERIHGIAVRLNRGEIVIYHAWWEDGQIRQQII